MTARIVAGLVALTLLSGCSTTRTLTDPRLSPDIPGRPSDAAVSGPESEPDLSVVREAEELVGTQDDAAGYLDDLIDHRSVLVDTLNVSALETDVPDISDSLAAATEASLPSFEEIFDYPVVVNRRVLTWVDVYTGKSRGSFQSALRRSSRYLPMARRIFAEEGIPQDLAFLGYVESGFRFNARSHARALGLWQFMRGTAGDLGLRCDERVDERLDPEKSTRACARYLKQLNERYDDWLLALAAYNTGPGNVDKAIRRAESRDFWEISRSGHLLHETRNFVPAILAATILAKSPKAYGFSEEGDPSLVYDTIYVDHLADLAVIARCADASAEEMRDLNPALLQGQTPGTRGFEVRVPLGSGPVAASRLAEIPPSDLIAFVSHTVRTGDTLGGISKRYGSSVRAIQDANGMGRSTLIRAGKTLRIPSRGAAAALSVAEAGGGGISGPAGPPGTHTVRRGETLSSIARRHGMSVDAIVRANRILDPAKIRPGQTLEIPGTRASGIAARGGRPLDGVPRAVPGQTPGNAPTASVPPAPADLAVDAAAVGSQAAYVADTATLLGRVESTVHLIDQARAALDADPEGRIVLASSGGELVTPTSPGMAGRPETDGGEDLTPSTTDGRAPGSTGSSGAGASPTTVAKTHRVDRGDTLYGIARRYGVDVSELRAWNGLSGSTLIRPGQSLRVSRPSQEGGDLASSGVPVPPKLHVVVQGDTLWQIARNYGVAVSDLARWNGLRARARIYPGQRIQVR